ncbi:MAG: SMC-Scp complex subunit ScpB [Gammaproteobacteria bacterium]|nr:SMC-Scp complex subunit ScpB [Gammaproteobacteria bacterium]
MESQGLPLEKLTPIIEAALFAASEPLSLDRLLSLFFDDEKPEKSSLREVIANLQQQCEGRGVELVEVASGYRYQVRRDVSQWVSRLWQERATRYSRALLETLVLIAYRQPVTRAEIEDIRGVAVSSNIMKTLQERGWARVIGHRDVPGRPGLYATTREFLDYFNLKSLDELPPLSELKDFDQINAELDLRMPGEQTEEDDDAVLAEGDEDLAEEVTVVSETTDTDETDDQEPQQPDLEQSDEVKVEEEIETPPSDSSDNEEQLPQ